MPRKPKLYTLSEVAKKTRISMSSLSRYKKHNQNRIPGGVSGILCRASTAVRPHAK